MLEPRGSMYTIILKPSEYTKGFGTLLRPPSPIHNPWPGLGEILRVHVPLGEVKKMVHMSKRANSMCMKSQGTRRARGPKRVGTLPPPNPRGSLFSRTPPSFRPRPATASATEPAAPRCLVKNNPETPLPRRPRRAHLHRHHRRRASCQSLGRPRFRLPPPLCDPSFSFFHLVDTLESPNREYFKAKIYTI